MQTTPTPELVALQYRKRPVVIEAVQLTNEVASVCLRDRVPGPFGLTVFGSWNQKSGIVYNAHINIETMEGKMRADLGDWIIREPFPTGDRQFYPCKPDIFAATYEPATRAATVPQGVSSGVVTDAHLVTLWRNQCVNQMSRELAISRSLTYEEGRLLAEEEAIRIEDVFRDSMQKIHEKKQPTPPPAELGKGDAK